MPTKTDPPDKDKEKESGEEELIVDDTEQIPDMGEGEEISTEEGETEKPAEAPDTGEAEEGVVSPKLQEIMKKKGWKNLDDFAKAYESSEKKRTELERDRRVSSFLPDEIPPRPKVEREKKPYPKLEKDPMDMTKEEYERFRAEEREAFKSEMQNMYLDAEADKAYQQEYRQAMKRINKDPEKFNRLKPIMNDLRHRYPKANFDDLYDMAAEEEQGVTEKRKEIIRNDLGLSQQDIDDLKALRDKARPATISGGSTGVGGAGRMTPEQREKKIKDDIFGKDSTLVRD